MYYHYHAVLEGHFYFLFLSVCICLLKWSVINHFAGKNFSFLFMLGWFFFGFCSWQWWCDKVWNSSPFSGHMVCQQFEKFNLTFRMAIPQLPCLFNIFAFDQAEQFCIFCVQMDSCCSLLNCTVVHSLW